MADINILGTINLGKVKRWSPKKAASIQPISFPGQDSGAVEGVDTLGIIAYFNIMGRVTGTFEVLQGIAYDLRNIADGQQTSSRKLISPFVNSSKGLTGSKTRHQGSIRINTSISANTLIDSTANFSTYGMDTNDKVKNLITGVVANVVSVDSDTQLTLDADIFTATGVAYAATANINVKIISFDYDWEIPGLSYFDYQLSIVQVV